MVEVFREVRRVLRPAGTLWLNLGDSYASGRHNTRDPGKSTKHPAFENWDKGRPPTPVGLKPKDLIGMPWRLAFALQEDGWWLRSEITWCKTAPMPESATDRPTTATEKVFLLTRSARYFYNADAVRTPLAASSVARLAQPNFWNQDGGHKDYGPDSNRSARRTMENLKRRRTPAGWNVNHDESDLLGRYRQKDSWDADGERETTDKGANMRNFWLLGPDPYPGAHFATFPREIPRRAIRAGCPEGGTVLDPFAGSGTTLAIARDLGRRSIGIELNPDYIKLIEQRCAQQALPIRTGCEMSDEGNDEAMTRPTDQTNG